MCELTGDSREIQSGQGRGISGSTLKLIAVCSMLIDHVAATIVERMITHNPDNFTAMGTLVMTPIVALYWVMRGIGRLAFPIFIFLLIEGLFHTRSQWKYLGRLFLFALISEIPFDMAFNLSSEQLRGGQIIEWSYQNVFFTLVIGLLTVLLINRAGQIQMEAVGRFWLQFVIFIAGAGLAFALNTDYDAIGIAAILAAYRLRGKRLGQIIGSSAVLLCSSLLELAAFIDVLPVAFYNGKRGLKLKWIFYIFYPAHLLILAGICMWMGL